jgi:hypothetical protein
LYICTNIYSCRIYIDMYVGIVCLRFGLQVSSLSSVSARVGSPHSTMLLYEATSRRSRSFWIGGRILSPSPRYTETCISMLLSECIMWVDIVICMDSVVVLS